MIEYQRVMFPRECTLAGLFMAGTVQTTRARDIFCFHISVPGVLGRVQFSSNSADVTWLFWPVICDSRTATATSEQECFRGRAVTGTDPNRGSGDGGSPISLGLLLLVEGHRQSG